MNTYLFEELPRADRNRIETITNKVMECHDDSEDMEHLKNQTIKTDETMKTTHTPGPWRYDGNSVFIPVYNNGAGCVKINLYLENVIGESQANARLIAAAPDMLSVLIEAVEHTRAYDTNPALVELFKRVISNATTQNT